MISKQMESCCGVRFLYDFGNISDHDYNSDKEYFEAIDQFLCNAEVSAARQLQSFIMVLINDTQMDDFGWIFKARGWKKVNSKEHIDHGSEIFLLVKNFSYNDEEEVTSKIVPCGKIFEPKKKKSKPKLLRVSSRASRKTTSGKKAANKRTSVSGRS